MRELNRHKQIQGGWLLTLSNWHSLGSLKTTSSALPTKGMQNFSSLQGGIAPGKQEIFTPG